MATAGLSMAPTGIYKARTGMGKTVWLFNLHS